MARGRVITPEFWTDGNLIGVSPFARLFYIGAWNFAYCDKGHLPDDPLGLKLKILPADPVDPIELLNELMTKDRVVRVSDGDQVFLWMPKFERHQKADQRWKTRCPACALGDSLKLTRTQASLGEHSETLPSSALREEERTREKRKEALVQPPVERAPAKNRYPKDFEQWWTVYPRKESKAAALKAFTKAIKTVELPELITATQNYSLKMLGEEPRFVKLPAGWLNDGKWEDEAVTAPALSARSFDCDRDGHQFISGPYCEYCGVDGRDNRF